MLDIFYVRKCSQQGEVTQHVPFKVGRIIKQESQVSFDRSLSFCLKLLMLMYILETDHAPGQEDCFYVFSI